MRNAADMRKLEEDTAACVVHGVGHQPPSIALCVGVDPRRPGKTLAFGRDLGGFCDDEPGRGALAVIKRINFGRHVAGMLRP